MNLKKDIKHIQLKNKVRIKVKTTGNIVDLKYTEEMIKSAKADLVNYIRQFINSPT